MLIPTNIANIFLYIFASCLLFFSNSIPFCIVIAIINKEDQNLKINTNILEIIITAIFVIISIGNILGFIADLVEDETGITSNRIAPWISRYQYNRIVYIENNQIQDENKIKYIKQYIKNEPYNYQNIMYEIMSNQIAKDPKIEDIDYLINVWKTIPKERKYEISPIQKRAEIMLEFAEKLIEKTEQTNRTKEILEIIQEEYEPNREIILDYSKNREVESITKFKEEYYTNVYKKATEMYKNIENKQ